jgi:hypothetical protein
VRERRTADQDSWFGLSDGTALRWELAGNSMVYGNLLDACHKLFTGDFDGDGKTDLAFYDGTWVTGISNGTQLSWRPARAPVRSTSCWDRRAGWSPSTRWLTTTPTRSSMPSGHSGPSAGGVSAGAAQVRSRDW